MNNNSVIDQLKSLELEAIEAINNVQTEHNLNEVKASYLGKKSKLQEIMSKMKDLSIEEKKELGQKINEFKGMIEEEIAKKLEAIKEEEVNKKLAEIVYQSETKLHLINQLMLPFIIKEIQSELNFLKQLNTKVVFIDAPLLFENGLDRLCDKTVCIYVDEKIIKQRFLERPEKTLEIFEKVIYFPLFNKGLVYSSYKPNKNSILSSSFLNKILENNI